ncbi:unnamed protein product [Phytophthora fragariaefolia]|uniref:Unnamed protein product n=1 Tax=Phytophthora fragariaefolia TaxID=1490495 RepID=A0A9W7D796_9STRA|nr:unnamed protein product [Phytophthora fragariaefolia]
MKLEAQALGTERSDPAGPSPGSSPVHFLLNLQKVLPLCSAYQYQTNKIIPAKTLLLSFSYFFQQFRHRRRYELSSCIVGLLGIVLMLVECDIVERRQKLSASSDLVVLVLKSCVLASTVLLDVLLVLRYRCDGQVNQLQSSVPSRIVKFSLWRRPLLLVLELIVCSFHVPPGIGGDVEIVQLYGAPSAEDDSVCESLQRGIKSVRRDNGCYLMYRYPIEVLGVFMVARLYLLARFVRSSSALHSPWISLVGSLNGVDAMSPYFHFKSIFKLHPLNILLPLTLLNTLLTASVVRVLERPVQAAFDSYWKAIWFTIVTLVSL